MLRKRLLAIMAHMVYYSQPNVLEPIIPPPQNWLNSIINVKYDILDELNVITSLINCMCFIIIFNFNLFM